MRDVVDRRVIAAALRGAPDAAARVVAAGGAARGAVRSDRLRPGVRVDAAPVSDVAQLPGVAEPDLPRRKDRDDVGVVDDAVERSAFEEGAELRVADER